MTRKLLGAILILGGMLTAAHADTWVMRDTLRPNGHERSKAAKYADSKKCGAPGNGRSFNDNNAPNMQQCMLARGWVLDHVIPDPVTRHARRSNDDYAPPVDNSANDDMARRQQDQDNLQQMLNTQQMINDQQMQNDQMFQQQQQQMINDMNNR
jgi:hypothetical protein